MPPKRKLKVYRTPIGFHDAYVAAPSQKAALAAWGSDANLFARGVAEVVTDPALTVEPLAQPGVVIRRSRGTTAEQIAALPRGGKGKKSAKATARRDPKPAKSRETARPLKPVPRPSRASLDKADRDLTETERRHRSEQRAIAAKLSALQTERRLLEQRQAREIAKLTRARGRAVARYESALEKWQG